MDRGFLVKKREMKPDRLMSEQEIDKVYVSWSANTPDILQVYDYVKEVVKAQDAKTAAIVRKEVNEEWVEWLDKLFCIRFSNGETEVKSYIAITYGEWQERKKGVGL